MSSFALRTFLAVLTSALAATLSFRSARAGADDEVVVSVGDESMTVADVDRRLTSMPAFQRRTLGKTPAEIRRAFVDRILVPELLYAAEAKRQGVERTPEIIGRMQQMLSRSVEEEIRDKAHTPGPSDAEIRAYYDAHAAQYSSPLRLRVWRIIVADEPAAKAILDKVKGKGQEGVTLWSKIARESSLDKSTGMRDGDIGLVRPDGTTESGRVKVDAKLFEAAKGVKDGELVAVPVHIDAGWAVVWRRGSLPAVERTFAEERTSISRQLEREVADGARRELLAKLRTDSVKDLHPELLQNISVSGFGTVGTPGRPGGLPGIRRRPGPLNFRPDLRRAMPPGSAAPG
jgi:peptidyl-prolyl cis-trans isomerase C